MRIPFAFIARPRALDDPCLKAQATRRHTFLTHFVHQRLAQNRSLPARSLHQTPLAALEDVDGMHTTDLIGVPIGLHCRRIHHGADGKVRQQQSIELLLDALGGLRAKVRADKHRCVLNSSSACSISQRS